MYTLMRRSAGCLLILERQNMICREQRRWGWYQQWGKRVESESLTSIGSPQHKRTIQSNRNILDLTLGKDLGCTFVLSLFLTSCPLSLWSFPVPVLRFSVDKKPDIMSAVIQWNTNELNSEGIQFPCRPRVSRFLSEPCWLRLFMATHSSDGQTDVAYTIRETMQERFLSCNNTYRTPFLLFGMKAAANGFQMPPFLSR